MTQEDLTQASREELVGLVLAKHARSEELDARLQQAEQQLRWFKQQLFGKKSERRAHEAIGGDGAQLSLGERVAVDGARDASPDAADLAGPQEAEVSSVRAHVRRRQPEVDVPEEPGLRFDDSVPVKTIVVPNPALDGLAEDEHVVVREKVTYRLAQEPASYVVLRIVRKVVKHEDTGALLCPPAPASVLEKSFADVSLLAGLLIDKFRYHLPLYRQHQRMKAAGIDVSRSSLSNWVHRAIDLLDPIYTAQLHSIVHSKVLAMDETPIRAGRKSKGKMRTAYFWPIYGDQDEVAFPYAPSRAHDHAEEILGQFCGTFITDGYEAYEKYAARRKDVVHAQCWVHTRRGFVKAEDVEPERAGRAIEWIGKFYEVEKEIRTQALAGEAKLAMRGERTRPLVEGFFEWIEQELIEAALLPENPFTKAARYALARKRELEVFLADPDVPLDTNHLERALRPVPLGRKNWLFCWTEVGAMQVGQIQSLITTCVLHDVDPYTYLVDVLQRVDTHPMSKIKELTPRLWKKNFGDQPMRSAIYRAPP